MEYHDSVDIVWFHLSRPMIEARQLDPCKMDGNVGAEFADSFL